MTPADPASVVFGVLLAGGRARRMGGGDKCLQILGGRPLLEHVVARARPQVAGLALNANGDPDRFGRFGLPVTGDVIGGYAGPLAGVLTGLDWAIRHIPACTHVATFATDTPFFPADLVARLWAALSTQEAEIARAASADRVHPVFALWPVALAEDLRDALERRGVRKIDAWTAGYRIATVDFPADDGDPFFNVNAPADLIEAERLLARTGAA
jgi:molybdopterin-guanine dinucleotide biosynthesis protein A